MSNDRLYEKAILRIEDLESQLNEAESYIADLHEAIDRMEDQLKVAIHMAKTEQDWDGDDA